MKEEDQIERERVRERGREREERGELLNSLSSVFGNCLSSLKKKEKQREEEISFEEFWLLGFFVLMIC